MQALQVAQQRAPSSSTCGARKPAGATGRCIVRASSHTGSTEQQQPSRRAALAGAAAAVVVAAVAPPALAASPGKYASDYTKSDSGLLYFDVTTGSGAQPKPGDVCVVHWAGACHVLAAHAAPPLRACRLCAAPLLTSLLLFAQCRPHQELPGEDLRQL